jgi:hypothetical protein
MSAQIIIWEHPGILARISDHISDCVNAALGRGDGDMIILPLVEFLAAEQINSDRVCILLERSELFEQSLNARTSSKRLQTKILHQPDAISSPLASEETSIFVRQNDQDKSRLTLTHVRTETLEDIASHADTLQLKRILIASERAPERVVQTPSNRDQLSRERLYWGLSVSIALLGAYALLSIFAQTALQQRDATRNVERGLRTQVLALTDRELDISALDILQTERVERLTPVARLDLLAKITAATPDSAMWQRMELTDEDIVLTGTSADISALEAGFVEAFEGYTLDLDAGEVTEGENRVSVSLTLREMGAANE